MDTKQWGQFLILPVCPMSPTLLSAHVKLRTETTYAVKNNKRKDKTTEHLERHIDVTVL